MRLLKRWKNKVSLFDLERLFSLALTYIAEENNCILIVAKDKKACIFISTASEDKVEEVSNLLSKWLDKVNEK